MLTMVLLLLLSTELRVPSKAKPVDLSQNPAAAAAAVEAALKFKAVAQAIPAAAISTAPVSGKRSPVALQVPTHQIPQMSLGLPAVSLGVPPATSAMAYSALDPLVPLPMSLAVPGMSPMVPEGMVQLSPVEAAVPEYNTPVALNQGLLMASHSNQLGLGSNGVRHPMESSVASSNSSICTRLDAGDALMSDLYQGQTAADGSSSSNTFAGNVMPGVVQAPRPPMGFQQLRFPILPASTPMAPFGGFSTFPIPQQLPQQQPAPIDLGAAAAAVRAEMERGTAALDSAEALQAAADRVASMLFNGPFAGFCMGASFGLQPQVAAAGGRKSRSVDMPASGMDAVSDQLQQHQMMRCGSF